MKSNLISKIGMITSIALSMLLTSTSYATTLHAGRYTATASARASVTVVQPLTLSTKKDFTLNQITQGANAEIIRPMDTGAAQVYAIGEKDHLITVSFDSQISLNDNAGNHINFINVKSDAGNGDSGSSIKLDKNGHTIFQLGGTRSAISKNQMIGMYTGSINATIAYQ